jgi:DNA-binding NarL/FixJ family response regulator
MTDRCHDEPMVRVLLADDHPVYRLGLRALLDSVDGLEVVGEAQTGAEAVAATAELQPDVVVMDLRMPGLNGIEATRRIVKESPGAAVLMLTYSDDDHSVLDAMLAGARGYVLKEAGKDAILRALHDVASGEMIFGASIAKRMPQLLGTGRAGTAPRPFPALTGREHEVLELLARGLNNGAIAARLGVGDKRVRNCVTEIYNKLGVADRAQAIIRARDAGLGRAPADQQ